MKKTKKGTFKRAVIVVVTLNKLIRGNKKVICHNRTLATTHTCHTHTSAPLSDLTAPPPAGCFAYNPVQLQSSEAGLSTRFCLCVCEEQQKQLDFIAQ